MDPAHANDGEPTQGPPLVETGEAAAAPPPSRRKGRPRWVLPLVGLGALAALGWWLLASQTGPIAPVDEAVPVAPAPDKAEPPAR